MHSSKYVYNVFLKSKFRPVIHVLRKDGSLMNPTCKILSGKKVFIHYFFLILCILTAKKKCKLYNHESVIIKFHFICRKIRKCAFCMFISSEQYFLFLRQLVNIRHSLKHVLFLFLDVFFYTKNR